MNLQDFVHFVVKGLNILVQDYHDMYDNETPESARLEEYWNILTGAEPQLEELDAILEYFIPDITCLQHRKLCRELVQVEGDAGQMTKEVYLKDLYKYLVELKAIDDIE